MENADTLTTQEIVVCIFIHVLLLLTTLYFSVLSDDLKHFFFKMQNPLTKILGDSVRKWSEAVWVDVYGRAKCLS